MCVCVCVCVYKIILHYKMITLLFIPCFIYQHHHQVLLLTWISLTHSLFVPIIYRFW